jgi:hypothetical protein
MSLMRAVARDSSSIAQARFVVFPRGDFGWAVAEYPSRFGRCRITTGFLLRSGCLLVLPCWFAASGSPTVFPSLRAALRIRHQQCEDT